MFCEFRKKYLPLSELEYNFVNDKKLARMYKTIIVGSDQVWNVRARDCDSIYFLPFTLEGKKISYACSINDTNYIEGTYDANLANNICDFDFISVREKSGKEKLEKFISKKKNVYTLLDPTLLCEKKDYEVLLSDRIVKQNYVFLYNVWTSETGIKAAKYISEVLNMPVYTIMTASNIKEMIMKMKLEQKL